MLTSLFVVLLAQTAAPAAPPGVVVLVSQRTGVTPERSLQLARSVSDALEKNGVRIARDPAAAQAELAPLMKDTTACEGNRQCLSKLATLLNAGAVVGLDVAEVMKETAVHLELIAAVDGTRLAEHNFAITANDKTPLATQLRVFSAAVLASLPEAPKPAAIAATPAPAPVMTTPPAAAVVPVQESRIVYVEKDVSPLRKWAWAPLAVGAAGLASGGTMMLAAKNRHESLERDTLSLEAAARARDEGKSFQTLGLAALGVGAAAVTGGVVMMLMGDRDQASAALAPVASPSGAGVIVTGTLP